MKVLGVIWPSLCRVRDRLGFKLGCLVVALIVEAIWYCSASEQLIQIAYIGPGAGIAVLGSFLAVLAAISVSFLAILTWPVRRLWRAIRGQKAYSRAQVKRVVIVGLDGLEPSLVESYLKQGLLPNLAKLGKAGAYRHLGTTYPPLSPVAWSSFATGANPGKHNIFDFLAPNRHNYKPEMSSVRISEARRTLKLGSYAIPLSRPRITLLRKSKPFWSVLGESGIFSSIVRVPITFPPDKFYGVQLSAMCVPDILGSQGTFFYYSESGESGSTTDGEVGGRRVIAQRVRDHVHADFVGPENPFRCDRQELRVPFTIGPGKSGFARLRVNGQEVVLPVGAYSDWVKLTFRAAPGMKINGVCRLYLKRFEEPFEMYCTPIQIDPEKPVMPISHPRVYGIYLSKLLGTYATLGLAEDTWSLSEGAVTEDVFLDQVYDIHREREQMLFDSLKRVRRGTVVCVFDAPDRVQHMFWRFLDVDHPALAGGANTHPDAIRDMYIEMDRTVGRVVEQIDSDTTLFVMSDHGFKPFRRGVDLNAWLLANGYLVMKDGAESSSAPYLAEVDWSQTRVYAIGLAGIYINQRGREAEGIVPKGADTQALVMELKQKLDRLDDDGNQAIYETVPREEVYEGPYVDGAPDLIIGYNVGYRVAWDAAVGKCGSSVFSDNTKAWSGDHCIHPKLVPGVLFSSRPLRDGEANIIDLAPTALNLMGVETPLYMDGKSLL